MKAVRKSFKYRLWIAIYCLIHLCLISFLSFIDSSILENHRSIIVGVVFVVNLSGWINYGKLSSIFEKKLAEEMKKPDVEYVELRFFLGDNLFWCLFMADWSVPMMFNVFHAAGTTGEKILVLSPLLLVLMISIGALIYKASIKIVLDHGQITKYVAGRKKVSGNVHEINPKLTFRYYRNKNNLRVYNQICFGEVAREDNLIRYREYMENAEQFAAYLKRRGFFEKIYES